MLWFSVLFFVSSVTARGLSDEEYSQLPPLFHLDDYDNCLSNRDGVYCLGVFELTPTQEPHSVYDLMKKHTEVAMNFNRTLIHRGFCLNKRCSSKESNATLQFEQCANVWAKTQGMRANLRTLDYCRTSKDFRATIPPNKKQELFIQIIYTIVFLNIVGTVYDLMTGSKPNKNKLLIAWSIPANWCKLTNIYEGGDPRLTALLPFHGVKVIGTFLILYTHNYVYQYAYYVTNTDFLEKLLNRLDGLILINGALIVHMFIVLTAFITAYNLLLYSEKQALRMYMLPMCIIKRVSRVSPLYMLVLGYAATWWPHARDGPLISTTIGKNSQICVQKFWAHAFYLNNIVDREYICVAPTWYLAVDLQLYTLVCFLTIIMWRQRRMALVMYTVLFFGSCVFNAIACYINNWKTLVFISTPENLRTTFEGVESFSNFYISTWGALAACFIGMFMAHVQFELQKNKINCNDYKLAVLLHNLSLPMILMWIIKSGKYAIELTSPVQIAVFVAVDRAVFLIIISILAFGSLNIDGPLRAFFSWSRWHAMARMSLAVMLIHWIVGMVIAARPVAYATSVLDVAVDWLATTVITYMLAVPATLLLQIPFQRFVDAILIPS